MRPKGLGRKLLLVLLGLVGCVLLIVALLPYVVSLDHVKGQIVSRLEAALQRKVEVGAVRLQILSGLGAGLEDVTVYNPPGWEQPYLLKAATLSVKVAWRPFLQRRIEITKMIMKDGAIVIERDAQGRLNLAHASAASGVPPASATTASPEVQRSPNSAGAQPEITALAGLRVGEVTLQDMSITFVDRLVVPGQAVVTAARDVHLQLRDVALGRSIPVDMSASVSTAGSRNVRLHGSVGPVPASLALGSTPIDLQLQTTDLHLDALVPYLGRTMPLAQGRVEGEIALQGSMASHLRLDGRLSLADAVLRQGIMADASTPLPPLTSTQAIGIDLPNGRAELANVEVNMAGMQLTIKGAVHTFTTTPEFDVQMATNTFTPEALLSQLPMLAAKLPTPTEARGKVQLQATLKGVPADVRAEAQIDLQEILLKSGSFNGGAAAGGGLLFETDKTEARLAAQVLRAEPPRVQVDVQAQRLAFDQHQPQAPAPTSTPAPAPAPQPQLATPPAPAPPLLPPLTLSGQVRIAEGRMQRLNFQQLTADLSLANGILRTTHQMQLYGGSSQGTSQVDLTRSEPSYSLDTTVAGLQIAAALDDLAPVRSTFLGRLDTTMRLSGRGFDWEVMQHTLNGEGHVKISEAQLAHLDLFPQLVGLLQHMGGVVGFTLPGDWQQGSWRTIEGDWRLQQGKILTDRLRFRREGAEALLDGHVGLDKTLDYTGTLFLPVKVSGRRGVPAILRRDDAGRLMVPFTVQGTLSAPRLSVDEQALLGSAQEELVETLRKRLGGKLDELLGQPSAPDQPSQEPGKPGSEAGESRRRPGWPEKLLQEIFRR